MLKIATRLRAWLRNQSGATAIEYALIASAMALTLIPLMSAFSSNTTGLFQTLVELFNHPMFKDGYWS